MRSSQLKSIRLMVYPRMRAWPQTLQRPNTQVLFPTGTNSGNHVHHHRQTLRRQGFKSRQGFIVQDTVRENDDIPSSFFCFAKQPGKTGCRLGSPPIRRTSWMPERSKKSRRERNASSLIKDCPGGGGIASQEIARKTIITMQIANIGNHEVSHARPLRFPPNSAAAIRSESSVSPDRQHPNPTCPWRR